MIRAISRLRFPLAALAAVAMTGGCDYSIVETTGPSGPAGISVTPVVDTVEVARSVKFTAHVSGTSDTAVLWSVVDGPGRVFSDGLYMAPDSIDAVPAIAHVRVSLKGDTSKAATATVVIVRPDTGARVTIAIAPTSASVNTGASQLFTATVTGSPDQTVTWSVVAGPGTINVGGLYKAPATLTSSPQLATVQAVSAADPGAIARATVTVSGTIANNEVCFERDVLPLIGSNCATSGCHNDASRVAGFSFTSYQGIRAAVRPGSPDESKLYRMMTTRESEDIMPPPPAHPLTAEQVSLIRRWILEGARETTCPPDACDTVNVHYSTNVRPVIANACLGCHEGATYANKQIDLSTYAGVKSAAQSGQLYGAISHASGYTAMPEAPLPKLDDCTIAQFKAWIEKGAPQD